MAGFVALSVIGRDRPGILDDVLSRIESAGAEVVDIHQNVAHGILSLFLLIKPTELITENLFSDSGDLVFELHNVSDFDSGSGRRFVLTAVGRSSGRLLRAVSETTGRLGINNVRIDMLSRGELTAMQFLMDMRGCEPETARKELLSSVEMAGGDASIEPEESFRLGKRLIVFDMDSTLVDAETIDEMARMAGIQGSFQEITSRAMRGEIDYASSLRERVSLLKGVPVSLIEHIRDSLALTPGTEELVSSLRSMKYRIAVVSSGFTLFTDWLKQRLGLDYAFGNILEIRDGRLTGRVLEPVIDAAGKQRIIEEIMLAEHLSPSQVVVVGDGANDTVMVRNAGLGIAFRGKEVLRKVADGSISSTDLRALLFCLGHSSV